MKTNLKSLLFAAAAVVCFTVGANAQSKMSSDTSKMAKSKMSHSKMSKNKMSKNKMSKMSDSKMKKDSTKM
jgi:pentapeptide MXKDX repeat protein